MIASRFIIIPAISFCMISALSGGYAGPPEDMKKKIHIDMDSNGKRIELKVGDRVQIELNATGSTGYAWYFDELDKDLFELIGEEKKVISRGGKDRVGTPVISIWKLRAMKPGTTIIRMSYYRVWEGKNKAVNQFEVSVHIAR